MNAISQILGEIYVGKKVLVTGHTGFKGSWLCQWLLDMGACVYGLALDPPTSPALYDDLALANELKGDFRVDIRQREEVVNLIRGIEPDFVFHLAAQPLVRLSYEEPVETFAANVMGTVHVLEALRELTHPCVAVMITTDKCYENREWLHSYREEDAMGGYDPYSASKGCAELVISSYRRSYFSSPGRVVKVASARAGNVIGGGDWAADRIVPDCIRAIRARQVIPVRNRTATRPWQHVLEPLCGYLTLGAALSHPQEWGRENSAVFESAFNFGPELASNRTVAELVDTLLHHTGIGTWSDKSDPHAPHEASKLNLAIDKAFHLLQWQPVWGFDTCLRKTAEWYMNESLSAREICRKQTQDYLNDKAL